MKISVLLNREPFDKIFERTLASFLTEKYQKKHSVSWGHKTFFYSDNNICQKWLCNSHINSIFIKSANSKIFDSINDEYKINPLKPWRSKFQSLYIKMAQSRYFSTILSNYKISIYPPLEDAENKLIIGGNNKIRLIDYTSKKVYVILKKDFNKNYINRELYARKNFKFLDIPKIYKKGNNINWYSEEYVVGTSPNRFEYTKNVRVLNTVLIGIHKMLIQTSYTESLKKYLSDLEKKILFSLSEIKFLSKNFEDHIIDFVSNIIKELSKFFNKSITMAYCHGDFHQGNILCNSSKNWILDWENSGNKQIGYDIIILLVKSRISKNFHLRFLNLIENKFSQFEINLINSWPELNWNCKDSKKISLLLFLLEETDFYLSENNNPLFYNNNKKIVKRFEELKKCFKSVVKI